MSQNPVQESETLADEMVAFSGSPESRLFYLKSIFALGPGLAREALGEVRMRWNEGTVENRAHYLTRVLKDWMDEREDPSAEVSVERPQIQGPLAQGLMPLAIPSSDRSSERFLDIPFSKKFIPHIKDLTGDFFALTNESRNKHDKWDKVKTVLTVGDKPYEVEMIRGKRAREEKGRGIPTTEHWKIADVVTKIWADQPHPGFSEFENSKARICVVNTNAREIAKGLGITFGGKEMRYITEKVLDLGSTGYLFLMKDNPEAVAAGIDDFSFQIFGEVQTLTRIIAGKKEKYFRIVFSEPYSRLLLTRKVVRRPLDMPHIRGDIALKLYDYLYRILAVKSEHHIELLKLIKALKLPLAGWHTYRSQRKREFEKAIREINGRQTHDKEVFDIVIDQGINPKDFVLIARLRKNS